MRIRRRWILLYWDTSDSIVCFARRTVVALGAIGFAVSYQSRPPVLFSSCAISPNSARMAHLLVLLILHNWYHGLRDDNLLMLLE
jgi:hypothetical protein